MSLGISLALALGHSKLYGQHNDSQVFHTPKVRRLNKIVIIEPAFALYLPVWCWASYFLCDDVYITGKCYISILLTFLCFSFEHFAVVFIINQNGMTLKTHYRGNADDSAIPNMKNAASIF